MTRKRLCQAERRRQIISVARDLFAGKGFRGATTRAIATAAGVSEAIIFRHFATKEDLYDAIIQATLEERSELWERDDPAVTQGEGLEPLLRRFADQFIRRNREDPTFIRLMMYGALEDHKFRERFFENYRSPYLRAIRERIRFGIETGEFRPVDPSLTASSFLWSLLQYCVSRFVASTRLHDPAEDRRMADNLVGIFAAGLLLPGRAQSPVFVS